MFNILKDKRGSAIAMAVVLALVAAVLATALYAYASSDMKILAVSEDQMHAQFLARSGLEAAMQAYQLSHYAAAPNTMQRDTDPVYYYEDGTYGPDPIGSIGYFTVNVKWGIRDVDPIDVNELQFTAEAYYRGARATAKSAAFFTKYAWKDGDPENWYNNAGKVQTTNLLTFEEVGALYGFVGNFNPKLISNGHSRNLMAPDEKLWSGITTGTGLVLPRPTPTSVLTVNGLVANKYGNAVLFAAPIIQIDMPINLNPPYSGMTAATSAAATAERKTLRDTMSMVVLSGSDIIINGDVELFLCLNVSNRTSNYQVYAKLGTLILSVDGNSCYRLINDGGNKLVRAKLSELTTGEAAYGKVYFNGNVRMRIFGPPTDANRNTQVNVVEHFSDNIITAGTVYVYKRKAEGIDLVGWTMSMSTDSRIVNVRNKSKLTYGVYTSSDFRKIETFYSQNGMGTPSIEDITPPNVNTLSQVVWGLENMDYFDVSKGGAL
jgi:hypothetical protein